VYIIVFAHVFNVRVAKFACRGGRTVVLLRTVSFGVNFLQLSKYSKLLADSVEAISSVEAVFRQAVFVKTMYFQALSSVDAVFLYSSTKGLAHSGPVPHRGRIYSGRVCGGRI
jgi:hypothetical protein